MHYYCNRVECANSHIAETIFLSQGIGKIFPSQKYTHRIQYNIFFVYFLVYFETDGFDDIIEYVPLGDDVDEVGLNRSVTNNLTKKNYYLFAANNTKWKSVIFGCG